MYRLKSLFAPRDLTVGVPWKQLVAFAIPMLIGNVAQQFYNTADSIIVGRYVGDNALAAVGSAGSILFLLLAFAIGISIGTNILVAQNFGAGDRVKLSRIIGNTMVLTAVVAIACTVIGVLFARPLLRLINTPESILDWCTSYLQIYFAGIISFFYYNNLSGILRGLGDSMSALLYLVICTVLNVVLDLWFVVSFGLGVAGVALATVLSQLVSAILCLFKLLRMRDMFDLSLEQLRPDRTCMREIIRMSVPSAITQTIFSLSILLVQSLTNSFGEMVIACNVIVMRVDGFAMMPNFTFNATMTTYAGQNMGAQKFDRLQKGARQGLVMGLVISTFVTILLVFFSPPLIAIFTTTTELIALSVRMLRILAVGYIIVGVTQVLTGVMRGVGDAMTPMVITILSQVVFRVPSAYLIAWMTRGAEWPNGRPESTFVSMLLTWILGAALSLALYRRTIQRKIEQATVSAQPPSTDSEPDRGEPDLPADTDDIGN